MSDTIAPPWMNGNRAASVPPTDTAPFRAPDPSKLLTSQETADMLGILNTTLEIWRVRGKGPAFIKLGRTAQSPVRYRLCDIERWVEERLASSTSVYSAPAANARRSIKSAGN